MNQYRYRVSTDGESCKGGSGNDTGTDTAVLTTDTEVNSFIRTSEQQPLVNKMGPRGSSLYTRLTVQVSLAIRERVLRSS